MGRWVNRLTGRVLVERWVVSMLQIGGRTNRPLNGWMTGYIVRPVIEWSDYSWCRLQDVRINLYVCMWKLMYVWTGLARSADDRAKINGYEWMMFECNCRAVVWRINTCKPTCVVKGMACYLQRMQMRLWKRRVNEKQWDFWKYVSSVCNGRCFFKFSHFIFCKDKLNITGYSGSRIEPRRLWLLRLYGDHYTIWEVQDLDVEVSCNEIYVNSSLLRKRTGCISKDPKDVLMVIILMMMIRRVHFPSHLFFFFIRFMLCSSFLIFIWHDLLLLEFPLSFT